MAAVGFLDGGTPKILVFGDLSKNEADNNQQAPNQPRQYSGSYMPNGGAPSGPVPGAVPLLPNQGRVIQQGSVRVLCIADVRGMSIASSSQVREKANY
jgi:hypothetical protein